jgi:hypothetical protein
MFSKFGHPCYWAREVKIFDGGALPSNVDVIMKPQEWLWNRGHVPWKDDTVALSYEYIKGSYI